MRPIDADAIDYTEIPRSTSLGLVTVADFKKYIDKLPALDIVKQGEWNYLSVNLRQCSRCKYKIPAYKADAYNYCPICGVKMEVK